MERKVRISIDVDEMENLGFDESEFEETTMQEVVDKYEEVLKVVDVDECEITIDRNNVAWICYTLETGEKVYYFGNARFYMAENVRRFDESNWICKLVKEVDTEEIIGIVKAEFYNADTCERYSRKEYMEMIDKEMEAMEMRAMETKNKARKIYDMMDGLWVLGKMADPDVDMAEKEEIYYSVLKTICNFVGTTEEEKEELHTWCLWFEKGLIG